MGWGYQHTPFYIPDPRDPYDVAETVVSHAAWGFSSWSIAYALTGSNPGPGHLGTLYRAFLSPAHLGSARNVPPVSAWDDTMFALRVYGTPFRIAARVLAPVGAAMLFHDVGTSVEDVVRTNLGMPGRHVLGSPMTPEEIAYFS